MATEIPVPMCDPHFHVWDSVTNENPNLGEIRSEFGVYLMKDVVADIASLPIDSGVHVETMVGQVDGGFKLDTVAESRFVLAQMKNFGDRKLHVVPFVHLGQEDAESVISAHRAILGNSFVGIRMILSFDDKVPQLCWPQVAHGHYLRGTIDQFNSGLALLEAQQLSFDLHANWHQLKAAASLFARYPELVVIVDHMGCPHMGDADDTTVWKEWREGIRALAANKNVYMKASNLEFIRSGWLDREDAFSTVASMVLEVIDVFGINRVMFASNFPVDKFTTHHSLTDVFNGLHRIVKDFSLEDKAKLFKGNAVAAYKL